MPESEDWDNQDWELDLTTPSPSTQPQSPPPPPPPPHHLGGQAVSEQQISSHDSVRQEISHATPGAAKPAERDRIVVLGRRRSGKTVFLARMYESAWNNQKSSGLKMMAKEGRTHSRLMTVIESLKKGEWPAATTGNDPFVIDVAYMGETTPLVVLDYSGEVFTRAFINDMVDEESEELRNHIDRAVGAVLLLDPMIAVQGETEEIVDDDYGMVKAIKRIREWPCGEHVPITLVLTKYDQHRSLIKSEGGLLKFVKKWYPNLVMAAGGSMKIYTAAAVYTQLDARGEMIPHTGKEPRYIKEPIIFCLDAVQEQRSILRAQKQEEIQQQQSIEFRKQTEEEEIVLAKKKKLNQIAIVIIVGLVVATAATLAIVFLIST